MNEVHACMEDPVDVEKQQLCQLRWDELAGKNNIFVDTFSQKQYIKGANKNSWHIS